MQKRVLIFREELGRYSETFIPNQARHLKDYNPTLLCLRDFGELPSLRDSHTIFNPLNGNTTNEYIYKIFSHSTHLEKFINNLNPSIIHIHFGGDACRFMPIYRRLKTCVPLLVTFHGQDATITDWHKLLSFGIGNWIYLFRRKELQQFAHRFLAVSNHIRSKLLGQGFPDNKVIVHHIGVDTKLLVPDPLVTRENIVLYVGRLVEKKGGDYLIRAMASVQRQRPETLLVMIGDGPLMPDFMELARSSGCRAEFMGHRSSEEVRSWMNRASVYCVPSITARNGDSEGLPITVLEAQAMGLPSVLFNTAPANEATNGGKTALLTHQQNHLALAENILRLLSDRDLWQMLSTAGQDFVHSNFNISSQSSVLESIYDNIILETSHK